MSKIVFLRLDGDEQVEVRMSGDATWMEVTSKFVNFLRGAGYSVTEDDVGQYLSPSLEDSTPFEWDEITISATDYNDYEKFQFQETSDPRYNFDPLTQATTTWFNK